MRLIDKIVYNSIISNTLIRVQSAMPGQFWVFRRLFGGMEGIGNLSVLEGVSLFYEYDKDDELYEDAWNNL